MVKKIPYIQKDKRSGPKQPEFVPPPFQIQFDGEGELVLPVFSDYSDSEWKSQAKANKAHFFDFKGSAGQTLKTEKALLLGLGDRKNFHPDVIVQSFRALGAKIASVKPESVKIEIPSALIATVESYGSLAANPPDPFVSAISDNQKSKKFPDYFQPFDVSDLVFQIVYSMYLGASPIGMLKTRTDESDDTTKDSKASKSKSKAISVVLSAADIDPAVLKKAAGEGQMTGELAASLRYIEALPANYLDPEKYEAFSRDIAKKYKLKISIIKGSELEKQGFGGVITVGKGSVVQPRVAVVEYAGSRKSRPIVLVGKGITFDTGGISLKPPPDMHEMKYDMCGSALALHGVALAAQKKIKTPVVALLGFAENMPDGAAVKPGDVYTAYNGVTVEVQNTDAEGRLVLADLLSLACAKYNPSVLFDFATLTGACVIALGHTATGIMSWSDSLYSLVDTACRRSLDRGWRLPHWQAYDSGLKSEVADIRNIAGRPAGTVTAMRFLSNFVGRDVAWAHFDIAGTAYTSSGAEYAKGPTAWGLRFLKQFFDEVDGR